MIPAATIAALAKLGLSEEQVDVVASLLQEVEEATAAAYEAKEEARKAKDRERKRRIPRNSAEIHGKDGNSALSADTPSPEVFPPAPPFPNPNPIPPSDPKGSLSPTPRTALEVVLDANHAAAVIEHRQRLRKPLTVRAAQLLAQQFSRCHDPNHAADEMIEAGWQGFKPEWLEGRTIGRGQGPPNGNALTPWQRQKRAFEELDDERPDPTSPERTIPSLPKPGAY